MRTHIPCPSTSDTAGLGTLLDRQAGLITRGQALAAGLSSAHVDDLVRRRCWRPVQPRVYLGRDHPLDTAAELRAALLWAGQGAVLSGLAAAWWHGLVDRPPGVVTLTVAPGAGRRPRARAGVLVRCCSLDPHDVDVVRGVAVTGLARTVLEAAVALGPEGGAFLDGALRRWRLSPLVAQAHRRMCGGPGADRAGRLLAAAAFRSTAAGVGLLVRLLRAGRMSGWRVEAGRVVFPASGVVVELSGWAEAVDRGHDPAPTVLRYSWHDLVERPTIVLARIAGVTGGAPVAARRVRSTTCPLQAGHLRERPCLRAGYPES